MGGYEDLAPAGLHEVEQEARMVVCTQKVGQCEDVLRVQSEDGQVVPGGASATSTLAEVALWVRDNTYIEANIKGLSQTSGVKERRRDVIQLRRGAPGRGRMNG